MSVIDQPNAVQERFLLTPQMLQKDLPASTRQQKFVSESQQTIKNIFQGKDPRLLVIVGPCSIHDTNAAIEYAELLKETAIRFANELFLVMRVYFEKPRTSVGWKGLISDPLLNGSFDINLGLKLARKLLLDLAEIGIPAGTEFLDTNISQYIKDLISWGCIGARTCESQTHREFVSSLSMPVGFKNTTDGNIKIAIDAVNTAQHSHFFVAINHAGVPAITPTIGNQNCHIILRGSQTAPNYNMPAVQQALDLLNQANLLPRLMIDCSHGNSSKNHLLQRDVVASIIEQKSKKIFGVMLESNLISGKQTLKNSSSLVYGQSITDACLSWTETLPLLEKLAREIIL